MQSGYPELDVISNVPTIKMNGTNITANTTHIIMDKVKVDRITGNGSNLTNLPNQSPDLLITSVDVSDANWNILDDTAVDTSGGFIILNGTGFGPGSMVQVDNTNAISVSYVSSNQLRVQVPPKPSASYTLTIVRADGKTAMSSLTYSPGVVWSTGSDLGNVSTGTDFSIALQANEADGSTVTYANVSTLPPDTTLSSTGNLEGNITSIQQDTLYSFKVQATDQENQDALREFYLQVLFKLKGGKLLPDDSVVDGNFGYSCAMSEDGTRVVIGARLADSSATTTDTGAAYIFSFTGVWTQTQKLTPTDGESNAHFGGSCSMSKDGSRVVIGAAQDDDDGVSTDSGAAYVFVYDNAKGEYVQEQKLFLNPSVYNTKAYFGIACSISDNGFKIIITAREMEIDGLSKAGSAFIFAYDGTSWSQEQQLLASPPTENVYFGYSCTMQADGKRVVVGATEDVGVSKAGSAYIFVYDESKPMGQQWVIEQRIVAKDPNLRDYFGDSCAISDDGLYLVVGATSDDQGGNGNGAAYIFTRDPNSTENPWTEEQKVWVYTNNGNFGFSCAMSANGQRVVIGTQDATGVSGEFGVGQAYIFSRDENEETPWTLEQILNPNDPEASAYYGYSCAMSADGEFVLIGAYADDGADDAIVNSGAAYAIVRSPAGVWE